MYWLRWHYHVKDIAGHRTKLDKRKQTKEQKRWQSVVAGRQHFRRSIAFGPAFSTPYTLVPRLPVPRFPPLHFWRCRLFRSRIFSRPGGNPSDLSCEESNGKASDANSRQSIHLALIKFNNNFFRGYAPNLAKSSVEWIVKFSLGHLVETSEMPSTLNVNTKVLNTALPIKNISIDGN